MSPAALQILFALCAPQVPATTLHRIVAVESRGQPHAVNVSGRGFFPADAADAALIANPALARGLPVAIGLMQVHSQHLGRLHLTVAELLDPCTNIAAGASILTDAYVTASARLGEGQRAMRAALSVYNTGNLTAGFTNGYVARIISTPPPSIPATPSAEPSTGGPPWTPRSSRSSAPSSRSIPTASAFPASSSP